MSTNETYLTAKQVRERFAGISEMTLHRWRKNPRIAFPQPIRIGGRLYFRLSAIEAYERRAAQAPPPQTPFSRSEESAR